MGLSQNSYLSITGLSVLIYIVSALSTLLVDTCTISRLWCYYYFLNLFKSLNSKELMVPGFQGARMTRLSYYLSSPNGFSDPPAELSSCWWRGLRCVHSPRRGKWAGEVSWKNGHQVMKTVYKYAKLKWAGEVSWKNEPQVMKTVYKYAKLKGTKLHFINCLVSTPLLS